MLREELIAGSDLAPNGCLVWTGADVDAARVLSWVTHFGDVPAGMAVRCTCEIAACVAPGHLGLVSSVGEVVA